MGKKLTEKQIDLLRLMSDGAVAHWSRGFRNDWWYLIVGSDYRRDFVPSIKAMMDLGYLEITTETWNSKYWRISDAGRKALAEAGRE